MILSVVVWLLLYFGFQARKVRLMYLILYTVIGMPLFFLSIVGTFIKLYLDRKRISGTITKAVTKNYIIANLIKENKRKEPIVCTINKDGMSFDYNDGLYLINQERIIWNDKNQPEGYWVHDDPEQKDIYELFTDSGDPNKRLYSTQNLKKFHKDKFFSELHRNPNQLDNGMMLGVIIVAIIVLGVVIVMTRGG